jgi:hypothetical protein
MPLVCVHDLKEYDLRLSSLTNSRKSKITVEPSDTVYFAVGMFSFVFLAVDTAGLILFSDASLKFPDT